MVKPTGRSKKRTAEASIKSQPNKQNGKKKRRTVIQKKPAVIRNLEDLIHQKLITVGQEVSITWFSCVCVQAYVTKSYSLREKLCSDYVYNSLNRFTNETHERAKKLFPNKRDNKSVHNAWDKVRFLYATSNDMIQYIPANKLREGRHNLTKAIKSKHLKPIIYKR